MSADEFRLWLVRNFVNAATLTGVIILWPHLPLWLYAVIGAVIILINPYRVGIRQAVAAKEAAKAQPKTLAQDPSKRGWS